MTAGERRAVLASVTSALDQTDGDVAVVVVAPEGAGALPADPRVRRCDVAAGGFAAEVGAALAGVECRFVKLLPAGDRLAPAAVAAQVDSLEARADADVVFSLVEAVDAEGRPVVPLTEHETAARTRDELLPALLGRFAPAVASALVRREAFAAAGGLDPLHTTGAAAHDLWLRLLPRAEAVLLPDRLARVVAAAPDRVERAERALARVRALEREGVERFLQALGGGPVEPAAARAAARLALVDSLLDGDEALLPWVHRLVEGALELGAGLGAARARRLAAAGLTGFAAGAVARRPGRAGALASAPALEGRLGPANALGDLRARRRRLAAAAVSLAASEAAAVALGQLAREVGAAARRGDGSPEAVDAGAPDPHALVAAAGRVAAASAEVLEQLRLGKRLGRAARRLLERTAVAPTAGDRAGGSSEARVPAGVDAARATPDAEAARASGAAAPCGTGVETSRGGRGADAVRASPAEAPRSASDASATRDLAEDAAPGRERGRDPEPGR